MKTGRYFVTQKKITTFKYTFLNKNIMFNNKTHWHKIWQPLIVGLYLR